MKRNQGVEADGAIEWKLYRQQLERTVCRAIDTGDDVITRAADVQRELGGGLWGPDGPIDLADAAAACIGLQAAMLAMSRERRAAEAERLRSTVLAFRVELPDRPGERS